MLTGVTSFSIFTEPLYGISPRFLFIKVLLKMQSNYVIKIILIHNLNLLLF